MSERKSRESKIKGYLPPAVDAVLEAMPVENAVSRRQFVAGAAGLLGSLAIGSKLDWFKPEVAHAIVPEYCNWGYRDMITYWWGNAPKYNSNWGDCFDVISEAFYKAMDSDRLVFMANTGATGKQITVDILTATSSYSGGTLRLASRNMTYADYGWNWADGKAVDFWKSGDGPILCIQGLACNQLQTVDYTGGNLAFKINNAVMSLNTSTGEATYYDMRIVLTRVGAHVCGPLSLKSGNKPWACNTTLRSSDWIGIVDLRRLGLSQFANLFAGGFPIRPMFDTDHDGGRYLVASLDVGMSVSWHTHVDGASVGTMLSRGRMPIMFNGIVSKGSDEASNPCDTTERLVLSSPVERLFRAPESMGFAYTGNPPNITGAQLLVGYNGGWDTSMGVGPYGKPIYWSDIYYDAQGLAGGFAALQNLASSSNMVFAARAFMTWSVFFCFAGYLPSTVEMVNMGDYSLYAKGLGICNKYAKTFVANSYRVVDGEGCIFGNPFGTSVNFSYPWGHPLEYFVVPGDDVDALKIETFDRKPTHEVNTLNAIIPRSDTSKAPTTKSDIKWVKDFPTVPMGDGKQAIAIGVSPGNFARDIKVTGIQCVKIHVYTDVPAQISIEPISGELFDLGETKEIDGKGVEQWTYLGKKLLAGGSVRVTVSIDKQHCYWDTLERTSPPGANAQVTKFTENTQIQYHTEANMETDVKLYYTTRPIYYQPSKRGSWSH